LAVVGARVNVGVAIQATREFLVDRCPSHGLQSLEYRRSDEATAAASVLRPIVYTGNEILSLPCRTNQICLKPCRSTAGCDPIVRISSPKSKFMLSPLIDSRSHRVVRCGCGYGRWVSGRWGNHIWIEARVAR